MFSVYGVTGSMFRGTLEQLIQVPGVIKSRSARGIAQEGEELGAEYRIDKQHDKDGAAQYAQKADAYAKVLRQSAERGPVRHAYQVMNRHVLTLRPDDTVAAAWQALAARHVRQAPVLTSRMDIVGLVSERDLLTVIDLQGDTLKGWLDRTIGEVMITPVICADPVTDIRRIARVLLDSGLSAVPIAGEAKQLLGIVSRGDILRAALADPPLSLWI